MRLQKTPFKLRVILLVGVIIMSCKPELIEVVIDEHENGSPKTIKYFETDVKAEHLVKEVQFYANGTKKYSGEFADGKKDGKWTFWFEDGKVWSEGYFKENKRWGKAKVYHKTGNLYYSGTYTNGKKDGDWKFYNKEGALMNKATFDMGKILKQTANTETEVEENN